MDKNGYIVNSSGLRLTGYDVDATGNIIPTDPVDLQFTATKQILLPKTTSKMGIGMNLDSRSTVPTNPVFNPNDTTSFNSSTSANVFDSLGNSHVLSTYFVKTAGVNTWTVQATFDGTIVAPSPGTLTFNGSGVLTTAMPLAPAMSLALTNGATSPLVFNLDFTGSTQFGALFGVNTLTQDGFSSGTLAGFNIATDGTILGRYTNGQSKKLGQVVLASFPNSQGLQSLGNNQWAQTPDSGQPLVGVAGTGKLGVLQSAAVEDSNVDMTAELVNMITAQRIYQANAQTIKTQDQVLQTLVNLR
jgi:flagellar hook protein FlgE